MRSPLFGIDFLAQHIGELTVPRPVRGSQVGRNPSAGILHISIGHSAPSVLNEKLRARALGTCTITTGHHVQEKSII